MSTIDTLRQAEARLREVAGGATDGPWDTKTRDRMDAQIFAGYELIAAGAHHADAAYIALMDPLAGLALADWLREEAGDLEAFLSLNPEQVDALPFPTTSAALALALRVLGEEE